MTAIDQDQLAAVSGGMKWEDFRRSSNIEDRRPPEAIAEDEAWIKSAPLRDVAGWGADLINRQLAKQWVNDFKAATGAR